MKLHEHRCTQADFCTRTHAYVCKLPSCGSWYKTSAETQWVTLSKQYVFPFYPYCSWECFQDGSLDTESRLSETDAKYQNFKLEFATSAAHASFVTLMAQTKEL